MYFLGRQQLREEEVGKIYPAKRLTLDQLDPERTSNPTHNPGQFVHLGEKFVVFFLLRSQVVGLGFLSAKGVFFSERVIRFSNLQISKKKYSKKLS